MFLFYQFLAERISEKEYSGSFTRVALKVSLKFLERVNAMF